MLELAAAATTSTSAWDEPGTIAFLVIVGMAVVLYFVFRSLARHLRKINDAARQEAAQAEAQRSPGGPRPGNGTGRPGGPDDGDPRKPWSPSEHEQQWPDRDAAVMDVER